MNSLIKALFLLCTTAITATLVHPLSPAASFTQKPPLPHTSWSWGLSFEEKTRLGSTPPSCHNKCNQCHPCLAVQVPTMPTAGHRPQPAARAMPMEFLDSSLPPSSSSSSSSSSSYSNKYSNYKPLGWKCRCGNHFFNP